MPAGRTSSRLRLVLGLWAVAEVAVYVLVAAQIGLGWTILITLATSALGWLLLARQGTRALADLRERAQENRPPGRALGDAGLIAAGGLLMVLPGFLGDLLGLLCLLPGTRALPRALVARGCCGGCPTGCAARCTSGRPARTRSSRARPTAPPTARPPPGSSRARSSPER